MMSIPTRKKRNASPEHRQQCALVSWARHPVTLMRYPELRLFSASLNGVRLSPAQAGKAKAAGVLAGEHDLRLPVARGGYVGLSIEMKAGSGRPSAAQLQYGELLEAEGWKVIYAWDWQDAQKEIEQYLAMPRLDFCASTGDEISP